MVNPIKDEAEYNLIISILNGTGSNPGMSKQAFYKLKKRSEAFICVECVLFCKSSDGLHKRILIQNNMNIIKLEVLQLHNQNHYGQNRLYELCQLKFFSIPRSVVREIVNNCKVCLQSQPLKTKEKMKHIVASKPWERLMIDLIDMRAYKETNEGFGWILTVIDVYSKFALSYPVKSKSAKDVSEFLEDLIYTYGPPNIIQSDNGKEFKNSLIVELAKRFNIKLINGRPRYPQSQGQVERFNQTLTRYLAKHLASDNGDSLRKPWLRILKRVMYDYNVVVHTATKKAPFELIYGRRGLITVVSSTEEYYDPSCEEDEESDVAVSTLPTNEDEVETFSLSQHQAKYLERMDRKAVHNSIWNFSVGEMVFVKKDFDANSNNKRKKLDSFYHKESKIKEILSNNRLRLELDAEELIISMALVKKLNP